MLNSALLQLLGDGEFHSGQELADVLGVSRTAVWKQLGKLEPYGLAVESIKGRGYRLPGGIDLLDRDVVSTNLCAPASTLLRDIEFLDSTPSTNSEALQRCAVESAHGLVVTAEHQSAGRGRRGRQWVSPYGGNLYLSLVWDFGGGAASLEGLSLAVGVAVAEALNALGLTGVGLKWPNDILVAQHKLGGILLEMHGDVSGQCTVIVGIGLNVAMPATASADIDQDWTDLRCCLGEERPARSEVLAELLNHLLPAMSEFAESGFTSFHRRWSGFDASAQRAVTVVLGEERINGTAAGVDGSGALQLQTDEGLRIFHGGEVSLRASG